jgi:hypothetical protein
MSLDPGPAVLRTHVGSLGISFARLTRNFIAIRALMGGSRPDGCTDEHWGRRINTRLIRGEDELIAINIREFVDVARLSHARG